MDVAPTAEYITLILTEREKLKAYCKGVCFGLCFGTQNKLTFIPKMLYQK